MESDYIRLRDKLKAVAVRLTPDRELRKDLEQEGVIALYQAKPGFSDCQLMMIARQKMIKYIFQGSKSIDKPGRELERVNLYNEQGEEYPIEDPSPGPYLQALAVDSRERIEDVLTQLEKEILRLKLEGYTLTEISKKLHKRRQSIGRVWGRASSKAGFILKEESGRQI